jgi:hypothetical protein
MIKLEKPFYPNGKSGRKFGGNAPHTKPHFYYLNQCKPEPFKCMDFE